MSLSQKMQAALDDAAKTARDVPLIRIDEMKLRKWIAEAGLLEAVLDEATTPRPIETASKEDFSDALLFNADDGNWFIDTLAVYIPEFDEEEDDEESIEVSHWLPLPMKPRPQG